MKLAYFLTGLAAGIALSATAATTISRARLTHTDAIGRVHVADAQVTALAYDGVTVSLSYTSDSLFCSAFGP